MGFYSYEGIPDSVLDKQHSTSTGETYSLRHNEDLKVEMVYLGKGNTKANSQGWERDSSKYFEALSKSHPEMFSKKNMARIKSGHAPVVDQKMISSNPNWAQYRNQTLVHHHIGGDGEAVALPQNAHKGQGEIHNYEKESGITSNCRDFSKRCASNPESVGKTPSQLHTKMGEKSNKSVKDKIVYSTKTSQLPQTSKSHKDTSSRSDAVRSSFSSNKSSSQTERRQSVKNSDQSTSTSIPSDRSDCVRSSIQSADLSLGSTSKQSSVNSAQSQSSNSSGSAQSGGQGR